MSFFWIEISNQYSGNQVIIAELSPDVTVPGVANTLLSVMRKNTEYERHDVIRAVASHLGFRRLSETIRAPIKSTINSAIRQGLVGYNGSRISREEEHMPTAWQLMNAKSGGVPT